MLLTIVGNILSQLGLIGSKNLNGRKTKKIIFKFFRNLLLLSRSKNSTLQNYDFNKKKNNETGKGYNNGSYREIGVSQCRDWNKEEKRNVLRIR